MRMDEKRQNHKIIKKNLIFDNYEVKKVWKKSFKRLLNEQFELLDWEKIASVSGMRQVVYNRINLDLQSKLVWRYIQFVKGHTMPNQPIVSRNLT